MRHATIEDFDVVKGIFKENRDVFPYLRFDSLKHKIKEGVSNPGMLSHGRTAQSSAIPASTSALEAPGGNSNTRGTWPPPAKSGV